MVMDLNPVKAWISVMFCRDWEDKHTCPLYIAFCGGLGRDVKGAHVSCYQSIYEPTEPSQPMISDDVSDEDRPQHQELRILLSGFNFTAAWTFYVFAMINHDFVSFSAMQTYDSSYVHCLI